MIFIENYKKRWYNISKGVFGLSKKELTKRYILFIISLFISGLGIAFTKHAGLGVSPISSVPNILSIKFPVLSMGNWLTFWNWLIIVGEILLLRKNFKPIQFLQIPLTLVFGYFTDFGLFIASFIPTDIYFVRLGLVILGVAILGFGVALAFTANVVMNAGEGFVKAVSDTFRHNLGNVKIAFDLFNVSLSIILSLIFFKFEIMGTREGTIIAAFCTGLFVKLFTRLLKDKLNYFLSK